MINNFLDGGNLSRGKKGVALFQIFLMIGSMFAFAFILADVTPTVSAESVASSATSCCEKTNEGAWCVNANKSDCNDNYKVSPTSCDTTSYCKLGTCYDSTEGICTENTPQRVCNDNNGTWDERDIELVPQCKLGCCIIGDQASFVSLVRCKRLSSFFGVPNDYRTDIKDEVSCIAAAQSQDMGACVYEKNFENVCKFTTRADCGADEQVGTINGTSGISSKKTFYKDYLCSAEELGTTCAKEASTTCYQGDVYWVDSCGNRENVYSKDKVKSWNKGKVLDADSVCGSSGSNDVDCGNCDYLKGTRCAKFDGVVGGPAVGDNYCKKTECVDDNGNKRVNGESWCVYDKDKGNGADRVGSRDYREICVDGKVTVEPCADYRNEICLSNSIDIGNGKHFGTAGCRVNRWQDCVSQTKKDDCVDVNKRDCMWLPAVAGMVLGGGQQGASTTTYSNPTHGTAFNNPTVTGAVVAPITGDAVSGSSEPTSTTTNRPDGVCVPNFAPGLKWWEDSSAKQICGQANAKCVVVYEKGLLGGWKIAKGKECLGEQWALDANRVCVALGDCGGYENYQAKYTDDGYQWLQDGKEKHFSPNTKNIITGWVVKVAETASNGVDLSKGSGPIDTSEVTGSGGSSVSFLSDSIGKNAPAVTKAQFGGTSGASQFVDKHFFNVITGGKMDAFLSGVEWAAIAYTTGQMLGSMAGLSKENTNALSTSLAAGFFAGKGLTVYLSGAGHTSLLNGWISNTAPILNPVGTGIIVGAIVFAAMYKDTKTEIVEFSCMPWQAPSGGDNCEVCNDAKLPCSEYRCKSLGQNCDIVNAGTADEKCVDVDPRDVNPPVISPNPDVLTTGYKYTNIKSSPPSPGFNIVRTGSDDGCLKAFTPLKFGITLDGPAQCKIDFNHTASFGDMATFVGGSNLYLYNHTEQFSLPSIEALKNSSLVLNNGKNMTFFIRCRDKNNNTNSAEYSVNFCVDPSPDSTPAKIEATSIANGGCVAENQSSVNVDFYTNEPADCRWGAEDQDYDLMKNGMNCSSELYQANAMQLFTCSATLTGIARDNTDFYVRCKDQPGADENKRNKNTESFKFSLRGSSGLKLSKLQPNGTVFGGVSPMPVELYAQTTFGCNDGQSICFYSETGKPNDYIQFFDTNNEDGISTQKLNLDKGIHKVFVKCVDAGGNMVNDSTEFNLDVQDQAPVIARIYEEEQKLKIVTLRNTECSYSLDNCDFSVDEGISMPYANKTIHIVDWNPKNTYHIKCRDKFKNEDAQCSAIVKPSNDVL